MFKSSLRVTTTPLNHTMSKISLDTLVGLLLVTSLAALLIIMSQSDHNQADAFIKFGYILNSTACDTCDQLETYSGRNVFCCLASSKCCGPNSLAELDALTTVTPAP